MSSAVWSACNGSILTALSGADVTLKKTVIFFMQCSERGDSFNRSFPWITALIYGLMVI